MNELIKVTKSEGGNDVVSARDVHTFLESKREFATWIKHKIDKTGFKEGRDYMTYMSKTTSEVGGRPKTEYAITIDMAKHLGMMEGNEKGYEIREYFIERDKLLTQGTQVTQIDLSNPEHILKIAESYAEEARLRQLAEARVEETTKVIDIQRPKVEYANAFLNSEDCFPITTIAKELGMSAVKLNAQLHNDGIQYKTGNIWVLYSAYENEGFMKTVYQTVDVGGVSSTRYASNYWTHKGRAFVLDRYKREQA